MSFGTDVQTLKRGRTGARGTIYPIRPRHAEHTLLADPPGVVPELAIVSVDDHLLEPPNMFEDRVSRRLIGDMPRVEQIDGIPVWHIGPHLQPIIASNAMSGRPISEWDPLEPIAFDEMRPGAWDPAARMMDMNLNGVKASLNFPSMIFGFVGQLFMELGSMAAGIAAVDAWNDFVYEEWYCPYPDRIIPMHLVWMGDVMTAAEQVRNAARGFVAVSFSEIPERLGLPSIHSGYWEPFFQACAETGTTINLHVGSSSSTIQGSVDAPSAAHQLYFPLYGMIAAGDWLYSRVAVRFPNLRIVLSEAGIGWVPMILDRLDHLDRFAREQRTSRDVWSGMDLSPAELLQRNFFFTTFEDPTGFKVLDRIGADNVMVEVDYPHPDSSWPNTQARLQAELSHLPADVIAKVTHGNAERIYHFTPGTCTI